jgi:hypothetical protein
LGIRDEELTEGGAIDLPDLTISDRHKFEEICDSPPQDREVSLRLSDEGGDLLIKKGPFALWVQNGKGDPEELLRQIYEQASFPAFFTSLLGLILLWRKAGEIEKVEKVLAVLALAFTTLFIILHHLTPFESVMDLALHTPWVCVPLAMFTIAFFFLIGIRILHQGGLPLPATDGELLLTLEEGESRENEKPAKWRFWRWEFWNRRAWLILVWSLIAMSAEMLIISKLLQPKECIMQVYIPSQSGFED